MKLDKKNDGTILKPQPIEEISKKWNIITLLLALFLGGLGAHRFYVGRIKSATLMLLITLFVVVVWLIPSFLDLEELPESLFPFLMGLGFAMIILRLFLGTWILIDIIMIFLGKFKDKKGKYVKDN